MKINYLIECFLLPLIICSCATASPQVAFQNVDSEATIIISIDDALAQVVAPAERVAVNEDRVFEQLRSIEHGKTAVVILENYAEPELGKQFRDRSLRWFMGLRQLGYERIVFLQGKGIRRPDGLFILAEYK